MPLTKENSLQTQTWRVYVRKVNRLFLENKISQQKLLKQKSKTQLTIVRFNKTRKWPGKHMTVQKNRSDKFSDFRE